MSDEDTFDYGVNIKELVRLLGERLYANPSIILRELISNASDACVMASAEQPADYRIQVYHEPDNQLVIQDNGRGMTREELIKHLSFVANSAKRDQVRQLRETGKAEFGDRIIGEFGLGFLSTFVVSDRVVVETVRRGTSDQGGWHWESTGDTHYRITPSRGDSWGTRVCLFINQRQHGEFCGSRFVRDTIRRFSRQILVPIYYGKGDDAELLNPSAAPWNAVGTLAKKEWQDFLSGIESHADVRDWLGAVTISTDDVQGVLYFPCYNATPHRRLGTVDVYCRGVLIEHDNQSLIRKSIRCVRGMVQSKHFRLRLDRGGIIEDEAARRIQEQLESRVLGHLSDLAGGQTTSDQEELCSILNVHDHVLMEGCVTIENEATFIRLGDLMPFSSTIGRTTIPQYVQRAKATHPHDAWPRVFYFRERVGSRQVATLVRKRHWELLDCSNGLHLIFLQRYAQIKRLQLHDIQDELDLLFDVVEPDGGWCDIIDLYSRLAPAGIVLRPKLAHVQNSEMPLTLVTPSKQNRDHIGSSGGENAPHTGGAEQQDRVLYVNRNNSLMQRLAGLIESKSIDREILAMILEEALFNILVFADEIVDAVHLFEHHQRTLTELCALSEQVTRLHQNRLVQREGQRTGESSGDEHGGRTLSDGDGSVFVGTPFKSPYTSDIYPFALKPAIEAAGLRPVMLEEVVGPGDIPEEILNSITRASAAVFDVSELNANVYYELGLSHGLLKPNRTILVCDEGKLEGRPFDVRHLRTMTYDLAPHKFEEFKNRLSEVLKDIAKQLKQESRGHTIAIPGVVP